MRWRWTTIAATLALFALAVVGARFVPQQFFPASDRPELLVDLKLPESASISASDAAAGQARTDAQGRPRRRPLELLRRPRRGAVLSAARSATAQRFLRPGGRRRQERGGARSPEGAHRNVPRRASCRRRSPASRRSSSGRRSAGRCNTASAAPTRWRCARSPGASPTRSAPTGAPRRSTSTGSSRRAPCASASTRIRRGCSASARSSSPRRSTASSPARRSPRSATTSTSSMSSRARRPTNAVR